MQGIYSDWALLMLPSDWLVWLATSSARLALYRMQNWHGPVRYVHLLGTAAFFGAILLLDLRLLGVLGREIAVDAMARVALPVTHLAFVVTALTGVVLVLYDPIQAGSHTWFVPKLLLVLAGVVNAAMFSVPRRSGLKGIGAGALTRHARVAAALSLLLWSGVIAAAAANKEERPVIRGRAIERPVVPDEDG